MATECANKESSVNNRQFENIPKPIQLPSFDHGDSFFDTAKSSAKRRGMSVWGFCKRKIANIILYRLAYFCPINSWRIWMHKKRGCNIGKHVFIGTQCSLDNAYPELIYIEDYAGINQGSMLLAHTNMRSYFSGIVSNQASPILICRGAVVGVNSTILPGITIGEYSLVSAGSVVCKNVAPYTIVMGNPAKRIAAYEHIVRENLDRGLTE